MDQGRKCDVQPTVRGARRRRRRRSCSRRRRSCSRRRRRRRRRRGPASPSRLLSRFVDRFFSWRLVGHAWIPVGLVGAFVVGRQRRRNDRRQKKDEKELHSATREA